MRKHVLTLRSRPFNNIVQGKKKHELRLLRGKYTTIKKNDMLEFTNIEDLHDQRKVTAVVRSIEIFQTVSSVFDTYSSELFIPGMRAEQVIAEYNKYYSAQEQDTNEVVVFTLSIEKIIDKKTGKR